MEREFIKNYKSHIKMRIYLFLPLLYNHCMLDVFLGYRDLGSILDTQG
jgi:hypothetical protein